jgi:hypothetical protein
MAGVAVVSSMGLWRRGVPVRVELGKGIQAVDPPHNKTRACE